MFSTRAPLVEEYLAGLDADRMTPKEALEAIYKLRALLERQLAPAAEEDATGGPES
jgi:hypothetical protein